MRGHRKTLSFPGSTLLCNAGVERYISSRIPRFCHKLAVNPVHKVVKDNKVILYEKK